MVHWDVNHISFACKYHIFHLISFQESEVVRFEMDESGMKSMLKSLKDIEEQIASHAK